MQTLIKISILSILISILQGCGNENSTTTYATTLAEAPALTRTDAGATINPATLDNISKEVATLIQTEITQLNEKEAITFNKETNYCDISGLKESQYRGDFQKITTTQSYNNCQETHNVHHGKLNINYNNLNEEGKYPTTMNLTIEEDFTFNKTNLKKNTTIESNIAYNSDKTIKEIHLKINGHLNHNHENYELQNITQRVAF